jgi:hypothetical protein
MFGNYTSRNLNTAEIREEAQRNWEEARQKMMARPGENITVANIRPGTLVLIRRHQRHALEPKWEGPFRVLQVRSKTAKLQMRPDQEIWQNVSNLKKYYVPGERVV